MPPLRLCLLCGWVSLVVVAEGVSWQAPAKIPGPGRGVFRILVEGKEVGREEFQIEQQANEIQVRARLTLEAGGEKAEETAELIVSPTYEPRRYEWKRVKPAGQSLKVQFEGNKAALEASLGGSAADQREFLFESPAVTILDNNFFHHYLFLLRQYDFSRGGAQQMRILIPQEALPALVTLSDQGGETPKPEGAQPGLRRLRMTTEDNEVWLWVDPNGELVRLTVPLANVEVVRQ